MDTLPGVIPVAYPDAEPIVATEMLELLQKPPVVASLSVAPNPWQTLAGPLIGAGAILTLTRSVVVQPAADV